MPEIIARAGVVTHINVFTVEPENLFQTARARQDLPLHSARRPSRQGRSPGVSPPGGTCIVHVAFFPQLQLHVAT